LSVAEPGATRNGRPDYPQIGERLRASRRERGLSLRDLAERLGVSPSLISQIERGRANPSVSTLYAIVSELDVSLDDLLFDRRSVERPDAAPRTPAEASDARPLPLQRAPERSSIRLASGVIWERLTTVSEPGTEFLYVTYEVGGASSPENAYQRHLGHEWGYVISGTLEGHSLASTTVNNSPLARLRWSGTRQWRQRSSGSGHLPRRQKYFGYGGCQ
jgi:transcriptional regulator with XRE-family HTH domain